MHVKEETPMKSIVLLQTEPGQAYAVLERLKRLSVVSECCTPFGRYDAAALIEGESLEDLWQIVRIELNLVRGVIGTLPCLIEGSRSLRNPPEHLKELALFSE
jgi:hypothetical protein